MRKTGKTLRLAAVLLAMAILLTALVVALSGTPEALGADMSISAAAVKNQAQVNDGVIYLSKEAMASESFFADRKYSITLGVDNEGGPISTVIPTNYTIIFDTYDVMQGNPAFEYVLSNISEMCREIWSMNENSKISIISYSAPKTPTYGVTLGSIDDAVLIADQISYNERGMVHQSLMNFDNQYPFVDVDTVLTVNNQSFVGYRVYAGLGNVVYDNYDFVYLDSEKTINSKHPVIRRMYEVDGVALPYGTEPQATDNITAIYYPVMKRDAVTGQLLDENGNVITEIIDDWKNPTGTYTSTPIIIGKSEEPVAVNGTEVKVTPIKVLDTEGTYYTDPEGLLSTYGYKMIPSANFANPDNKVNYFSTNTNPEAALARLEEVLDGRSSGTGSTDKVIFITDSAPSAAIGKPIYNWAQSGTGDTDGVKIATEAAIARLDQLVAKYPDLQFVPVGLGGFSSGQGNLMPYFDGHDAEGKEVAGITGLLEALGAHSGNLYIWKENVFSVEQATSEIEEQRQNVNRVFEKAREDLNIVSEESVTYATPATVTDTIPAGFTLDTSSIKMYNPDGNENVTVIPQITLNADGTTTLVWHIPNLVSGKNPTMFTYDIIADENIFGGSSTLVQTNVDAEISYTNPQTSEIKSLLFPKPEVYIPYAAEAQGGEDTIVAGQGVNLADYVTSKVGAATDFTAGFNELDIAGQVQYTWYNEDGQVIHTSSQLDYHTYPQTTTTYTLVISSASADGYTRPADDIYNAVEVQKPLNISVPVKINVIENTVTITKNVESKVEGVSPSELVNAQFVFNISGKMQTNAIVAMGESKTLSGFPYGSYVITENDKMNYSFNRVVVKKDGTEIGRYTTDGFSFTFANDGASHNYEFIYYNDFTNETGNFSYNTVHNNLTTGLVVE